MPERQVYSEEDIQRMSRWGGLDADKVRETVGRGGWLKPDAEALRKGSIIQLPSSDRPRYSEDRLASILDSPDRERQIRALVDQLRASQLETIYKDIQTRFPGKTVGVRGITCSIDHPVVLEDEFGEKITVLPVDEIIKRGQEKTDEGKINVVSGTTRFPKVAAQYLVESTLRFYYTMKGSAKVRDRIRPAVVVYDMEQLEYSAETLTESYAYSIRQGRENQAVLAIYLVDPVLLLPVGGVS